MIHKYRISKQTASLKSGYRFLLGLISAIIFIALLFFNLYSILLLWFFNTFLLYTIWNCSYVRRKKITTRRIGYGMHREERIALKDSEDLRRKLEELEKLI